MKNQVIPSVHPLGFGASPLGSVFGDVSQTEADHAVETALDGGIDFFDVAPYYGETKAEIVLGNALRGVRRDRFFLATKVGRYTAGGFDFSYKRVLDSIDDSLQRLQIETIDLIQCHDIEFVPETIIHNEALPALRKAREQGKVRFIGITGLPTAYLYRVAQKEEDLDAVLSYCHLTLSDTSLTDYLPALFGRGLSVISASPLAMGLLSPRPLPDWHPAPTDLRHTVEAVNAYCRQRGLPLEKIALQYALAEAQRRGILVTLVGMRHRDEVQQNLAWFAEGAPDPEVVSDIQNLFAPIRNLTWPSGLPENQTD